MQQTFSGAAWEKLSYQKVSWFAWIKEIGIMTVRDWNRHDSRASLLDSFT